MGLHHTNLCRLTRCVLSWGLASLTVFAVLAGIYVYHHVDEKIRSQVETHLSSCFPHASVAVRSARLIDSGGFELNGLSLSTNSDAVNRAEMAHFDEVRIHCRPRVRDLLAGELEISRIVARRVTIRLVRHGDGSWNLDPLLSDRLATGRKLPQIDLENATVEVVDLGKEPPSLLTLRGIDLSCSHVSSVGARHSKGRREDVIRYSGSMAGDPLRLAKLQGTLNMTTGRWTLSGEASEFAVTPELVQSLPASLSPRLHALKSLRARGSIAVKAEGNRKDLSSTSFNMTGRIHDGQYESPQLPYPVTNIQGQIVASNQEYGIRDLTARYARGKVRIHSWIRKTSGVTDLDGTLRDVPVDRPLVNLLPATLLSEWNKLQPLGTVDADVRLSFDGETWSPNIRTRWSEMNLKWSRYPVQLSDGHASVDLNGNVLSVRDAVVHFREQPIQVRAVVHDPGSRWTGWVEARSLHKITIDDRLIDAMDDRPRQIVRSFSPRGSLSFYSRVQKESTDSAEVRKQFVADISDCTIRYSKFAYPLGRVSGRIKRNNDHWLFEQLTGENDQANVICNGSWNPNRSDHELLLTFETRNITLESELRDALPEKYQEIWSDLRPRGVLNQANILLSYSPSRGTPQIELQLLQPEGTSHGQSISMNPVWFPYALENVSGKVTMRGREVALRQLRARHGPVRIVASADGRFRPDGNWEFDFQRLTADQVPVDRELMAAMPASLSKALSSLEVKGQLNLDGAISFRGSGDPRIPIWSQWDVDVFTTGASMVCAVQLDHVTGLLHLRGTFNGDKLQCDGRIEVDSALWDRIQVTKLSGPISISESQIGLGTWAQSTASLSKEPAQHMAGSVFGGQLQGDARIQLDANTGFQLRASLANAQLADILRDFTPGTQRARGRTFALVELTGNSQGLPSLRGRGRIGLREAELYNLPLMVALLKVLRIGSADRTAFTSSEMSFRVRGDHVQFDQLDLSGDAISLKGNGWMTMDQRINLDFYSLVGRESDYIPDLLPFLREASRNVLQIHVTGTMSDPATMANVLPGLNETLQRMFPETTDSIRSQRSARKRNWLLPIPTWR